MSRVLILTLAITVDPIEIDPTSNEFEFLPEDAIPTGTDADIEDTSSGELGLMIASTLTQEHVVSEMFAGSNMYMTLSDAQLRSASWEG